jgi:hypothetical protein
LSFEEGANWYFDQDVTTIENIGTRFDFYSVAIHALGHIFGFGTTSSWNRYALGSEFLGPESEAANFGLAIPFDGQHWARRNIELRH